MAIHVTMYVTKQSTFKAVQSLSFGLVLPYPLQQNIRVGFPTSKIFVSVQGIRTLRERKGQKVKHLYRPSSHNSLLRDDVAVVAIQIHKYLSEEHI